MSSIYSEHKWNGSEINLTRALEAFERLYYLYYSAEESGAPIDYSAAVTEFDRLIHEDLDFQEIYVDFGNFRGDMVISDREAAAFMLALREAADMPQEVKQAAAVELKTACPVDYTDYEQAAGQTVTGNGWTVDFDDKINKTIVTIISDPSGEIKRAVIDAGFWYSPTFGTYNKKFTRKAHRAALELIKTLNGAAA